MNVIGHETPAQDLKTILFGLFPEDGQIDSAVVIYKEHVLTIVALLGDVMRHIEYR